MAFDLTTSLTFEIKDGTARVGYLAHALDGEDHDEQTAGGLEVADGATETIALGGLSTVEALALKSDFPVTVKLNGEATGHPATALYLAGASITAITVANASGSKATVRYVLAGT